MLPIYARLQDDNEAFRRAFVRAAGAIALVSFPAMFALLIVADFLVLALFGETWRPAIPVLAILAPLGAVQSLGTTAELNLSGEGADRYPLSLGSLCHSSSGSFVHHWAAVGDSWCCRELRGRSAGAAVCRAFHPVPPNWPEDVGVHQGVTPDASRAASGWRSPCCWDVWCFRAHLHRT